MGTSKGYLPPTGYLWSEAKREVTKMVKNNFSKESIGNALSKFSEINSTNKNQIKLISSSIQKAVSFFININEYGLDKALDNIGLKEELIKNKDGIYIGLLNYFSNDGSSIDKNIVRDSMSELLKELILDSNEEDYDKIFLQIDINMFIENFLIKCIQKSFLTNFSEKINGLCKNLDEYIQAEKDIKDFIRITIENNYTFENLNKINWKGKEGEEFITKKCNEIYSIFKMWKEDL